MTGQARLLQHCADGARSLVLARPDGAVFLESPATLYELAEIALRDGTTLEEAAAQRLSGTSCDIEAAFEAGRLLPAIDHKDAARLTLSGTGLTHLGSAEGRDKMHQVSGDTANMTDTMRMFQEGLEGGRPGKGEIGQQPEWFFKGDGQSMVGPRDALRSPTFAQDGSEEPEIAGVYIIGGDGKPYRLGFVLTNEFSDHVTEKHNYLWLAHSKLRPAAIGAELLLGDLPRDITGSSAIIRDGAEIWKKAFLTGEANMSHSIANLEHHHFKYAAFRRPGDIHIHFFGTATLSFADGVRTQAGDVFEIRAQPFALPLRNELKTHPADFEGVTAL